MSELNSEQSVVVNEDRKPMSQIKRFSDFKQEKSNFGSCFAEKT